MIIGAGLAGLSCAQALVAEGIPARVFERAWVVGGRCATRLWQGHLVDTGVQYFTAQSNDFKKELLTRLRQFRPIISPVLDRHDRIVVSPAGPRFYVLQGNNYFAHVLSRGLDIRANTTVETVMFHAGGIECLGETYPAVVSALPGPETARLFGLGKSPVDYEPCLVALLEYGETAVTRARECYARLLPEGNEPVLSSYCENHKAGRIVGNKIVFVVQGSPRFTREHADSPAEVYLQLMAKANEALWRIPSDGLTASYGHLWRQGRPLEYTRQKIDLPPGAFICGDTQAESTVENVWLDGRATAKKVVDYLKGR